MFGSIIRTPYQVHGSEISGQQTQKLPRGEWSKIGFNARGAVALHFPTARRYDQSSTIFIQIQSQQLQNETGLKEQHLIQVKLLKFTMFDEKEQMCSDMCYRSYTLQHSYRSNAPVVFIYHNMNTMKVYTYIVALVIYVAYSHLPFEKTPT